jgi:hypothetical protein
MRNGASRFVPKHRHGIVREVADDFIVYDEDTHRAHCLNSTAAQVWRLCDGKKNVAEITRAIEKDLQSPVGEDLVWVTLRKLWKSRLLQSPEHAEILLSRRAVVRRIGMATLAVPIITSILVPKAEAAVSCSTVGGACNVRPCCPGLFCSPVVHICG